MSSPVQDEVLSAEYGDEDAGQNKDPAERRKASYRAVLEKKLSIAERAVETNPTCIALQLERLRICQELWEPPALAKEWKKLVSVRSLHAPVQIYSWWFFSCACCYLVHKQAVEGERRECKTWSQITAITRQTHKTCFTRARR